MMQMQAVHMRMAHMQIAHIAPWGGGGRGYLYYAYYA